MSDAGYGGEAGFTDPYLPYSTIGPPSAFARARRAAFEHVEFTVVPELGWVFGRASAAPSGFPGDDWERRLTSPVRYHDPEVHRRLAFLPRPLAAALEGSAGTTSNGC